MKKHKSAVALLAIVATTLLGVKDVHAELVFEEDLETQVEGSSEDSVDVESREETRRGVSRSESLRRHRMRAELKNEDMLTEKLEELRLKDEMKRVNHLVGEKKEEPVQEQPVGALAVPAAPAVVVAPVAAQPAVIGQSIVEADVKKEEEPSFKNRVSVTPRGGLSGIISSNIEVSSRYTVGLGLGVDISEHFAVEAGYTRAEYRLNTGNLYYGTPFYSGVQQLNMAQNVFDLGVRFNILNSKSRVRPFIAGGVGYYRNNINMDATTQAYLRAYNPMLASDYIVSGFLGYLGTGAEFKITENISISGLFRYYNMLSSNSSNPVATAAVVNGMSVQGVQGANYGDPREQASRSLGKANFYTVQAGLTLSF